MLNLLANSGRLVQCVKKTQGGHTARIPWHRSAERTTVVLVVLRQVRNPRVPRGSPREAFPGVHLQRSPVAPSSAPPAVSRIFHPLRLQEPCHGTMPYDS